MKFVLAGLFGHHHQQAPQATPSGEVVQTAQSWYAVSAAWIGAHWQVLAVVIPVAGAIAAGLLNHYLAVAREKRTRRLGLRDVRERVFADLAARLLAHCTRLQHSISGETIDAPAWQSENASLHRRAQMTDVVDALGRQYVPFMAAIESERRAIAGLGRAGRDGWPARDAAWRIVEQYLPFIVDFGEETQARRLQQYLRDARRANGTGR